MAYPMMFLVRDIKNNTLFVSENKEEAIKWGKRLDKARKAIEAKADPLCLIQSQFIGYLDKL
jgi:hypothetical protein